MSNKYLFLALYQKLKTKRIIATWKTVRLLKQVLKQQEPITLICSWVRKLRHVLLLKECQIHEFHHLGDVFKRKKFQVSLYTLKMTSGHSYALARWNLRNSKACISKRRLATSRPLISYEYCVWSHFWS